MNTARLIKDSNNNIFIEITGKPIDEDKPVYFMVELFATEPEGKIKNLTKQNMIVDLSGRK